jgi:hypothetical protein
MSGLPYVQGIVNECLRWLPVTPLGQSFVLFWKDIFLFIGVRISGSPRRSHSRRCIRWLPDSQGYYSYWKRLVRSSCLWVGSDVLNSLRRAILHNPEDYPDPETFDPSRYLTPEGSPFVIRAQHASASAVACVPEGTLQTRAYYSPWSPRSLLPSISCGPRTRMGTRLCRKWT